MRNIIVPTDFSENAANALKYAINMAFHFDSKIHLIHVYNSPPSGVGMMRSVTDFMRNDAEGELSKIVNKNKERLLRGTSLVAKAIEGYTEQVITQYAKSIGADLIIMGTQGGSGLKEIFIGSNTSAVIKHSEVPVLAIPNNFTYQRLKDIALAIDGQVISSADVVEPLIILAKEYQSHVSVLHVEKAKIAAGIDEGINVFLTEVAHSFNTIYKGKVTKSINDFVLKTDANMLCMIHRDRGYLGNLFHKSVVKKEAFDSPVPLLVLYDKY